MEFDLSEVLKECRKSADAGSQIASAQHKALQNTLSEAMKKTNATLLDFKSSPCYVSGATDMLSKQLEDISSSFDQIGFAFKEDLVELQKNLSRFSITLFGRTMAGKSTLMEILTEGNGETIGKGAQRTTRDIRTYTWNGMDITDVPGVGAFEGEEDEMIAFDAAKRADMILFLLTDDAPQAAEAECFSQIINLGKPVICIMNVKVAVPETKSMKLIKRDIETQFNEERLEEIRKQFLSYAEQMGQVWNDIPFVFVHLKSAFMAQHEQDEEKKQFYEQISRMELLKEKIVEQVKDKGRFYRIKNFVDIISVPMLDTMESLLSQALLNSAQGRIILTKKRQLNAWKNHFTRDAKAQINSFITQLQNELEAEIAPFVEEHYDDRNADQAWNDLIQARNIQEQCVEILNRFESICNDKIKEVSREISNELRFSASFAGDRTLRMNRLVDGKRICDWTTITVSGGLSIAAVIAGVCGAACAGPLGWAALGTAGVGVALSFLLKNREKQAEEARAALGEKLKKNVKKICDSLTETMGKNLSTLENTRIVSLIKELDRMNSAVFQLADVQKELAWNLDNHLLELNRQIVNEAVKLSDRGDIDHQIDQIARIPGTSMVFIMKDGNVLPEEVIPNLNRFMSERIDTIGNSPNKRTIISRILGNTVNSGTICLEQKIGIAHIKMKNTSPDMLNRISLAQQVTKLVIMKE